MIPDRRVSPELRATIAGRDWQIQALFQPQWLFKPGPRKLSRVPNEDDPWEVWLAPAVFRGFGVVEAKGIGATPDEAVKVALASRSNFRSSVARLEAAIESIVAVLRAA